MCSQKKVAANRRNALKSTGPTSKDGKNKASQNAVKHGLTAQTPVVLDESPAEFDAMAQAIRQELRPSSAIEEILVQRIILATWKLQRTTGAEVETIHYQSEHYRTRTCAALVGADIGSSDSALARLQTYEMRLERSIHASLRQLAGLRKLKQREQPRAGEVREPEIDVEELEVEPSAQPQAPAAAAVAEMQNEPTATGLTTASPTPRRLAG